MVSSADIHGSEYCATLFGTFVLLVQVRFEAETMAATIVDETGLDMDARRKTVSAETESLDPISRTPKPPVY